MSSQSIKTSAHIVQSRYEKHKKTVENWQEGEPQEAWYDRDGYMCIKYESGKWWHYKSTEHGLEFW